MLLMMKQQDAEEEIHHLADKIGVVKFEKDKGHQAEEKGEEEPTKEEKRTNKLIGR